ncbi:hypothetical protein GCM10017708_05480 [Arthrobacter citreus]
MGSDPSKSSDPAAKISVLPLSRTPATKPGHQPERTVSAKLSHNGAAVSGMAPLSGSFA